MQGKPLPVSFRSLISGLILSQSSHFFSIVHLVDFGLAKKYTSSATGHEKEGLQKVRIGTQKYMSANVFEQRETGFFKPSRRDDCISILFVLAYLRDVRPKYKECPEQLNLKYKLFTNYH